jgi:peptidoglycan/xylan/chitin deacetylase (PgdA/CDA1 family)
MTLLTRLSLQVLCGTLAFGVHTCLAEAPKDPIVRKVTPAAQTHPVKKRAGLPLSSVAVVAPNKLSSSAALALVSSERDKYWLVAKEEIYKSSLELQAQDATEALRGIHVDKVMHGPEDRREIALTFDDGPHPAFTMAILKILERNNINATFFVVGEKAEEYPDLVRAEVADGNSIGNHTYDHVSLVKIPTEYISTEIKACGDVIQEVTGKRPTLFRPPGGEYDKTVADDAALLGYKMILYTDDPGDYAEPGEQVIEDRTLDTIHDGGIILLHDGSTQTLAILQQLIQRLKDRGDRFVTVDQLLAPEVAEKP